MGTSNMPRCECDDENVGPAATSETSSKRPRFLAGRRQVGRFDCGGYKQELLEGHLQLAKAALTENKRVKLQHFVADGQGQC